MKKVATDGLFRSLVEQSTDAIAVVDRDHIIRYQNEAISRVLGYRAEAVVGQPLFGSVHADDLAGARDWFRGLLDRPGHHAWLEVRCRHSDGGWRDVEVLARNLLEDPAIGGIMVTFRDITERRRAEGTLRRSEEALKSSNQRLEQTLEELRAAQNLMVQQERLRALGEMASGIAHDFNNSLSAILGFSEALLLFPEDLDNRERVTEHLQMITTISKDASSLVDRLREFYRSREADEVVVPTDLNRMVEQVIALTQPKWRGGVRIRMHTDLQNVPLVLGNEPELRQMLTNLIFNAVDAMPDGGTITFRTRIGIFATNVLEPAVPRHAPQITACVALEVSDTGIGMPEEVRKRCLEPFFTTKGKKGTGLGLAMIYGVIQRHQGAIEVASQVGQGTTFTLRFPMQAKASPPRASSGPRHGTRHAVPAGTRTLKVLLAEDDARSRRMVEFQLSKAGHEITIADSTEVALEMLRHTAFDLVITAAAAVKEAATAPVILLSAQAAARTDDGTVVRKPVTGAALKQAIERLVR